LPPPEGSRGKANSLAVPVFVAPRSSAQHRRSACGSPRRTSLVPRPVRSAHEPRPLPVGSAVSVSPDPIRVDRSDPDVSRLLERCTFPPAGTAVVCGVSGGADSTALLALAVAAGLVVEAVHVDHSLRRDSD